jgi:hypothetical protein
MNAYLDSLGFKVEVSSPHHDFVHDVCRDFSYFASAPGPVDVRVELHQAPPPCHQLPAVPAAFSTPRNVCFHQNGITYIDYFGCGLAIYDRRTRDCIVYGRDRDLVHEIAYMFILSTVGQYLDRKRIHRLHALGLSYRGQGVLLLASSGGGKSTMALRLLREPGFLLLSDDSPLIDRRGRILPFPLHLGVRPEVDTGIPSEYRHTMKRMEFDPQTRIAIEYFRDRLGTETPPAFLLVGERNLGEVSEIVPLSRIRAFHALLGVLIVGLGVYQGLEFLLKRGVWELVKQGGVVASRTYNASMLLRRSRTYRFMLGRNMDRNIRTLLTFLDQQGARGA